MAEISAFVSREVDQEIDTIEIIPEHPDFILIGTYHLVKDESQSQSDQAIRHGSLQILPLKAPHDSTSVEQRPPHVYRKDFQFAVVDAHFHHDHLRLLGAATSTGRLYFFRIHRSSLSTGGKQEEWQISLSGYIPLSKANASGQLPLVTQFQWLDIPVDAVTLCDEAKIDVMLAACDSNGDTHIVRVSIPKSKDVGYDSESLPYRSDKIHSHHYSLEAWTVSVVELRSESTPVQLLLSGGDDSHLIGSQYHLAGGAGNSVADNITLCLMDKRTHTAGVIGILPLSFKLQSGSDMAPLLVLTGSYDQKIRLLSIELGAVRTKCNLLSDLALDGGVWRLYLLDTYSVSKPSDESGPQEHWVILIAAMYTGAYVVRLILHDQDRWTWNVEAKFSKGHSSMVYACVAQRCPGEERTWLIISTSFYDKKICAWEWKDEQMHKSRDRSSGE